MNRIKSWVNIFLKNGDNDETSDFSNRLSQLAGHEMTFLWLMCNLGGYLKHKQILNCQNNIEYYINNIFRIIIRTI